MAIDGQPPKALIEVGQGQSTNTQQEPIDDDDDMMRMRQNHSVRRGCKEFERLSQLLIRLSTVIGWVCARELVRLANHMLPRLADYSYLLRTLTQVHPPYCYDQTERQRISGLCVLLSVVRLCVTQPALRCVYN